MLHKDFLVRQIQQAIAVLMQALAQVLRLKSEENYEAAIQQIRETFGRIDLSPRPVGELSEKQLIDLCRTPNGFNAELALGIADLLSEEGEILALKGEPGLARSSYSRALALYREAVATPGAAVPLDIGEKVGRAENGVRGS